MALIARGMYKLLLRVDVVQDISQEGWRFLVSEMLPTPWENRQIGTPSFDGEILCISAMSPMDMSAISAQLIEFGFRWSEDLLGADFAWFAFETPQLEWLVEVKAHPIRADLPDVNLWHLRGSEIPYFVCHDGSIWWRDKDYSW